MATIEKISNSDGSISYRVKIRKKGIDVSRTFRNEEDAIMYGKYKERLIENMENFDVPLKSRVTLRQIFELKPKETYSAKNHNDLSLIRFEEFLGPNRFYEDITFDEWRGCVEKFAKMDVFKGGRTEKSKRLMSPQTIRRMFAMASSVVSHAQSLGIELENHPLRVIQTTIRPKL